MIVLIYVIKIFRISIKISVLAPKKFRHTFSQKVHILLDARVSKSSRAWTRALRVDSYRADKLLASRQFTRPKSVHAITLENDRCKRA
jgi:hypothetical protein